MENIDATISEIEQKKDTLDQNQLAEFIMSSLAQIKKINESYKKLFENQEGKESLISDVEQRLRHITTEYEKFFGKPESGISKIDELNGKLEDIKKYHQEILEGDKSIKSDIEESQEKITDFYVYLFGGSDGSEGQEKRIRAAIESIVNFHTELTKEGGLEKAVENAHKQILEIYNSFYSETEGVPSKISTLNKQIEEIQKFEDRIKSEITPLLEQTQLDLQTKRKEVDALLSDATVRTLADGYLEAMHEYSKPKVKKYIGNKISIINISILFFNLVGRHFGTFLNYFIFIAPLIGVAFIFVNEHTAQIIFNSLQKNGTTPSPLELIYVKTIVSLPLIWIAWFGQKNISQRKRLFEEYNHKLRVVQMYLLLNSKGNPYNLDKIEEVGEILKQAIKSNPAEFLGDGETMVDHILEKFRMKGFYQNLKSEIIGELNPIKNEPKENNEK